MPARQPKRDTPFTGSLQLAKCFVRNIHASVGNDFSLYVNTTSKLSYNVHPTIYDIHCVIFGVWPAQARFIQMCGFRVICGTLRSLNNL
jgi:hypothetical protein